MWNGFPSTFLLYWLLGSDKAPSKRENGEYIEGVDAKIYCFYP